MHLFNLAVPLQRIESQRTKSTEIQGHQCKKFAVTWPVVAEKWKQLDSPSKGMIESFIGQLQAGVLMQLLKRMSQTSRS